MKIKITDLTPYILIKMIGKFNIEKVIEFEESIKPFLNDKTKVIAINLSEIKYIDSSAIGALIKTMNISKVNNIEFYLYDLDQNVVTIFKHAYLDKFFNITESKDLTLKYPEISFQ